MVTTKEKYLSEALMKDKPVKKLSLVLKNGAITTDKLADNAVTSAKIADHGITWDDLDVNIQNALKFLYGMVTLDNSGDVYSEVVDSRILLRVNQIAVSDIDDMLTSAGFLVDTPTVTEPTILRASSITPSPAPSFKPTLEKDKDTYKVYGGFLSIDQEHGDIEMRDVEGKLVFYVKTMSTIDIDDLLRANGFIVE